MIFVTPFNSKAPHDYEMLAKCLKKQGPLTNHTHLVISTEEDEDKAFTYGSSLSDLFASSKFLRLPQADRRGADLPNELFNHAVRFIQTYQHRKDEAPNQPMLYGDPAYLPNKKGWLDSLQNEYFVTGAKPVFGSVKRDSEGVVTFVGPVIISAKFANDSALINFLRPTAHWRETLKWELSRDFQETDQIVGKNSVFTLQK